MEGSLMYINIDEGILDISNNDLESLRQEWNKYKHKIVSHKLIYRKLNNDQISKCDEWLHDIRDNDISYNEYRRIYSELCRFMHIPSNDSIIEHTDIVNYNNNPALRVVYSQGLCKINVPENVSLIHISDKPNLRELKPTFKSKLTGNYLYPSKRIFFTLMRDLDSNKMGLEYKSTYRYRVNVDKNTNIYIDPSNSDFNLRSVYIATDTPIQCELYEDWLDGFYRFMKNIFINNSFYKARYSANKDKHKYKNTEEIISIPYNNQETIDTNESASIDFINDDTPVNELFFDQLYDDIKNWKTQNEGQSKQTFQSYHVTDRDYSTLKKYLSIMRHTDDYGLYKRYFNAFCRYCHILPTGTVLYDYKLTRGEHDHNIIEVTYSYNNRKIIIPKDAMLYHLSSEPNLHVLKPYFRSKEFSRSGSKHRYFYSSPRIYMTLNKNMSKLFADYGLFDKVYYYKIDKNITQAYVDPLVPSIFNKAVYIESMYPIHVSRLDN